MTSLRRDEFEAIFHPLCGTGSAAVYARRFITEEMITRFQAEAEALRKEQTAERDDAEGQSAESDEAAEGIEDYVGVSSEDDVAIADDDEEEPIANRKEEEFWTKNPDVNLSTKLMITAHLTHEGGLSKEGVERLTALGIAALGVHRFRKNSGQEINRLVDQYQLVPSLQYDIAIEALKMHREICTHEASAFPFDELDDQLMGIENSNPYKIYLEDALDLVASLRHNRRLQAELLLNIIDFCNDRNDDFYRALGRDASNGRKYEIFDGATDVEIRADSNWLVNWEINIRFAKAARHFIGRFVENEFEEIGGLFFSPVAKHNDALVYFPARSEIYCDVMSEPETAAGLQAVVSRELAQIHLHDSVEAEEIHRHVDIVKHVFAFAGACARADLSADLREARQKREKPSLIAVIEAWAQKEVYGDQPPVAKQPDPVEPSRPLPLVQSPSAPRKTA